MSRDFTTIIRIPSCQFFSKRLVTIEPDAIFIPALTTNHESLGPRLATPYSLRL